MTFKIVHYINQFYAGIGGEEKADHKPEVREGIVGPGMQLAKLFEGTAEVVATVICGDGFYGEHTDEARAACLEMVKKYNPDLFVAGPAFNAGRYGFACGDIAATVGAELNIPTVTAMYPENPGVELYSKKTFIALADDSARGMGNALTNIANIGTKLLKKEAMGPARLEGYIHRGMRKSFFHEKSGAERAVEMLLKKLNGEEFRTEYEMPVFKKITPAAPVKDLKHAKIALVSSGGIVPKGNPDHIRVSSAESFGEYDISALNDLTAENYESVHGGYDRQWANIDPDVVVPLQIMRELEKEGVFGELHKYFYTTTGTGTAVAFAEKFGQEIGEKLKADGVDAVILTSTWGTCTRCGASMTREIERVTGVPVVQIATIVPIMLTVGANRIVPGVAIPHPAADPALGEEGDKAVRREIIMRAFKAMTTPIEEQTIFEKK